MTRLKRTYLCLIWTLSVFCVFSSCQKHSNTTKSIKILFGGDILLDRGVRKEIDKRGLISLFDSVKPLFKEYDFVIANLECPFADKKTPIPKQFSFIAPTSYADSLKAVGFSHLFLANNHTNDHHRKGLMSTSKALQKTNVKGVGYGNTHSESCQPVFIEKQGNKIAVFSAVRVPLESWFRMENRPSICQASIKELSENIKFLKKEQPRTLVIVSLHWGVEYKFYPMAKQRKAAQELILAGADAIVGHHPHVTQSIEFINEKPVFFSLGNFIFDQKGGFKDRCILVGLEIKNQKIRDILVYPLKIQDVAPQFFRRTPQGSLESIVFEKHLKKISKNILFEKDSISVAFSIKQKTKKDKN